MNFDSNVKEILVTFKEIISIDDLSAKKNLLVLESDFVEIDAIQGLLRGVTKVISDPKHTHTLGSPFSFENEYRRLSQEFNDRFSRYLGNDLHIKQQVGGFVVFLANRSEIEEFQNNRTVLNVVASHLEEFLMWELRKVGLDMKFRISITDGRLYCDIWPERGFPKNPNICENCGEYTNNLDHFTRYRYDEFICRDCYREYLHNLDS